MNPDNKSTSLVLAFHGLGMSPDVFGGAVSDCLGSVTPWVKLSVPEAPRQPVTYMGGTKHRRWFDIERTPVTPAEEHEGLSESVAVVHDMIRKAEASGIPADQIVLAGFSQGAVLALAAGLTYERALAGICAFSGWLPAGVLESAQHRNTPIFMSHGSQDTLIPLDTGLESVRALKDAGYTKLQFQTHPSFGHTFGNEEQMMDLKAFVLSALVSQKNQLFADAVSTDEGSDNSDDDLATSDEDSCARSRRNSGHSQRQMLPRPCSAAQSPMPSISRAVTSRPKPPSQSSSPAASRPIWGPPRAELSSRKPSSLLGTSQASATQLSQQGCAPHAVHSSPKLASLPCRSRETPSTPKPRCRSGCVAEVAIEDISLTFHPGLTKVDTLQPHNQIPASGSAPMAFSSISPSLMQPLALVKPTSHPGAFTIAERLMPILQQGAFSMGEVSTPPVDKIADASSFASGCSPIPSSPSCVVPLAQIATTLSADAFSSMQKGAFSVGEVNTSPIERLLPISLQGAFSTGKVSSPPMEQIADASSSSASRCSPTPKSPRYMVPPAQSATTLSAGAISSARSPKGSNVLTTSLRVPVLGKTGPQRSPHSVSR